MEGSQQQRRHSFLLYSCFAFSLLLIIPKAWAYDLSRTTELALYLQAQQLDLNFSGDVRETRLYNVDLVVREPLAERLDGAFLIGHTSTSQSANPILAAQDTEGGYMGLDLRLSLIDSRYYRLLTRASYRYSETEANIEDQTVTWEWHQAQIDLINQLNISNNLYSSFGVSAYVLDGREKAFGTIDQNTDFEAKDSVFGHLSLQFNLAHSGFISLEIQMGSIEGGRIAFHRAF